jgi:hypothetical protein
MTASAPTWVCIISVSTRWCRSTQSGSCPAALLFLATQRPIFTPKLSPRNTVPPVSSTNVWPASFEG